MFISALLPRLWPMFQVMDGAGGGSGTPGAGAGAQGSGSGQPGSAGAGSQGAGAGSGGSAPAPITLTADSMFIPPGATTPVKFSDYQRGFVPLDQHNTQKSQAVAQALRALVAANKGRKPAQSQPQQQPTDPFADVRGVPVMSGDAVAQLAERVQREGIAPLYEWAAKVNQYLENTNQRLTGTERVAGSYAEQQQAAEFKSKIGTVLGGVGKKLFPGVDLSQHPVLNDIAEDVYLSYQPNDPNLEREYPGMLEGRLQGMLKLAEALTQAKVEQARTMRKNFLRPGGQGQPSGQGGNPRLSHRDIARNAFADATQART